MTAGTEREGRLPKLPCCEHGCMTGWGDPDVECCICSRNFCRDALVDLGDPIRRHLFAESERAAWFRDHPQTDVAPW